MKPDAPPNHFAKKKEGAYPEPYKYLKKNPKYLPGSTYPILPQAQAYQSEECTINDTFTQRRFNELGKHASWFSQG